MHHAPGLGQRLLSATESGPVRVRFHAPPDDLRRFFTTFYLTEFACPPGEVIRDSLHPEWAGLRFFESAGPNAWMDNGQRLDGGRFQMTGPSSDSVHFAVPPTRMWGIGLLPLGWAQFFAIPASSRANTLGDGGADPACAWLQPLADTLFETKPDEGAELARIVAHFRQFATPLVQAAPQIAAVHAALIDPECDSVTRLVAATGIGQRTIERLCSRAFGFPPKLLLRRQRFMRSLVQFMLEPDLKWIAAMDSLYHDQAQFVRDFHAFMGCTPREYAAQPHPILEPVLRERARITGSAVQTLDRPEGGGVRELR
jgi:AraC-like DNA-binding protein